FRREHFRPQSRTHHVAESGVAQPNIVPDHAQGWYPIRDVVPPIIRARSEAENRIPEVAAPITVTRVSPPVAGAAWLQHGNKVVAETVYAHIKRVGRPNWSEADQAYARRVQEAIGAPVVGLRTEIGELGPPVENPTGGGSDDIGDVMWTVPTVTLRYP